MELSLHFQTDIYGLILCEDFNLLTNHDLNYWLDYSKNIKNITIFIKG